MSLQAREGEKKEHKVVNVNDMIYKSHRRQGSNSSNNSDVFEDTKPGMMTFSGDRCVNTVICLSFDRLGALFYNV